MTRKDRLQGVLPVFQTPFKKDESIDAATLSTRTVYFLVPPEIIQPPVMKPARH